MGVPLSYKKVHANRPIERDAVNTARVFFDAAGVPFFEIDLSVDYGTDAVIELTDGDEATGRLVGLQVKGGNQTHRGQARGIPYTDKDARHFRQSNIPVLGVVQMAQANYSDLYWVNLTDHCRQSYSREGRDAGGFAPTPNHLNRYRLEAFLEEMRLTTSGPSLSTLLDLASDDSKLQQRSVVDCFLLSRHDPRPLLLIRRLIGTFAEPAVFAAISVLTHVVGHGDIFYHPKNTLSATTCREVRKSLVWSRHEITTLLELVSEEDDEIMWGRGSFGQSLIALLLSDRRTTLELILIAESRGNYSLTARRRAYIISVYAAQDSAREISARILRYSQDLLEDEQVLGIARIAQEEGWFDLYV